jgi:hypothetical protein
MNKMKESLQFCNEWRPHRQWLKDNNVELNDFTEEELYLQHQETYNFDFEKKKQKLRLAI